MLNLGKTIPERTDVLEAYHDLKTPDIIGTVDYWTKSARCDLRPTVTEVIEFGPGDFRSVDAVVRNPEVLKFYKAFRVSALKRGIPLFLSWVDLQAGQILHCYWEESLGPLHWEAYEALGLNVAITQSIKVEYLGHGIWQERKSLRRSMADTAASLGLVISPISGEWQTLEERIIEAEAYGKALARRM